MWSYIKSLALRTMLTLACLALLTVNRPAPSAPGGPLMDLANRTPAAASIEMQVVFLPMPESRLPRGNLAMASAAAEVKPEPALAKPAADTTEILLFQAIIAQAEFSQNRTGGPARSSGGPGGGTPGRSPDPDLSPEFDTTPDMPPKSDPMYDTWQQDADIKLKSEEARKLGKEHPLAVANPDSYLVICLGGCRPASDKIVYRVSKTAAAAAVIAARRMETTAAQVTAGAEIVPSEADQNAVACIAGCYANEEISPAMKPKRAEAAPAVRPVRVAKVVPAAKAQPEITLASAHRISEETRGHIAKKRVTNVMRDKQVWRTKIAFATKKAARMAAKRDGIKRAALSKISRGHRAKRNAVVTEASGFIF
jgi:hypothetical protein